MSDIKAQLHQRLSERRDEMVDFLRRLIRCRTPNPPGDTRPAVQLIETFLAERGIAYEVVAPNEIMPNIVAQFTGGGPGPKLVMNGHVDVFPVGDGRGWRHEPWEGAVDDGCVYGRGACDMKSGTTALLFGFAELHALRRHLKGSLVLTIVSDEETFGPWGARYLLKNRADVLGDCLLNSEPTSPYALRFGEKGPLWLNFHVQTRGAHSAYQHMSGNAITIATEVIAGLRGLTEMRSPPDSTLALTLNRHAAAIDRAYGPGASKIITAVTVNPGVIHGGLKINMIPSECRFEIDIRIPPEVGLDRIMTDVKNVVGSFPEVSFDVTNYDPANASPPDHPMVDLLVKNSKALNGVEPAPIIGLGGTDARLWRQAGVPAFVYGPSPTGMGTTNEHVRIEEFMHIATTHALAAYDYLSA